MLSAAQGFTYNKFETPNDWPKIDKTFDYKIENGKLLSGNEHIYLSGPAIYTKVGNPTIVDGVASGFSTSNRLYVQAENTMTSLNGLELCVKAKINFASAQAALSWEGPSSILGSLGFGSSRKLVFIAGRVDGQTRGISSTFNYEVDTYYYLRVKCSNNVGIFDYSIDGNIWQNIGNVDITGITLKLSNSFGIGAQRDGSASAAFTNGSIDLNETYIKFNGNLWFYGKNYTTKNMVPVPAGLEYNNTTTPSIGWVNTNTDRVKGPVNYTIVGSPTIVDGVASGFSSSDYLRITNISNEVKSYFRTSFEIQTKIKLNNIAANSVIFYWPNRGGNCGFSINAYNVLMFSMYSAGSTSFNIQSSALQGNEEVWLKGVINNNLANFMVSMDGTNWVSQGTLDITDMPSDITSDTYARLGVNGANIVGNIFTGSIDLNETYIKINGQPWFGNCPSEFQQFTPAPKGTMIGKDETQMLQVETYQDKGIVDYTVVGNPTIVDGVVNYSNSSNYLKTIAVPLNTASSFEINLSLKTDDQYAIFNGIFGNDNSIKIIRVGGAGNFRIVAGETSTDTNYGTNTSYLLNIKYDNGVYTISKNGTIVNTYSGNTPSTDYPFAIGTVLVGNSTNTTGSANYNQIDLNETYIKVNGQYWFHPYPNSYPKLVGPVNYTTVGSPTIENGILSNITSNDFVYVIVGATAPAMTDIIELGIVCTPETIKTSGLFSRGDATYAGICISSSGQPFARYLKDSDSTLAASVTSDVAMQANTTYYIKMLKTTDTLSISVSSDNQTWITNSTSIDTSDIKMFRIFSIGYGNSIIGGSFEGTIDLNETYIKINGSLLFGKENWNPSTYTDNAIYLLGSHKADYSNYNQLSFTPSIETESDEVGSYNVWIDNQKVIENKTGNTLIEWDKLALTTGYSITTPSALKAHPIKIEPTNSTDSIIAFNTKTIEESDESI